MNIVQQKYVKNYESLKEQIRKNFRHTLVKDYRIVFTRHFIDRCAERQISPRDVQLALYEMFRNHRYRFVDDGKFCLKMKDLHLVFTNAQDDKNKRCLTMKTIFDEKRKDKLPYTNYIEVRYEDCLVKGITT